MSQCSEDSAISSSQQKTAFSVPFEHLGVAAAEVTLDGRWLSVNQKFRELTGYSGSAINSTLFHEFLIDTLPGDPDLQRLISKQITLHTAEKMARVKDGRIVALKTVFSLLRHPSTDQPASLLVLFEDISDRPEFDSSSRILADRLIQAQEAERTRIARELHDDIGQDLAILCVQMQRAGKPVSGLPQKQHPGLSELTTRVRDIADKVSRISHELHSSKLEYLGLKVAVQSACREFSEGSRITVDCVCEHVPTQIDETVGVCFLRVVQEALHNISKHSGANRAEVRLAGSGNDLRLVVIDHGVGFDVHAAQLSDGLGLMSMRERLHLIGGQFEITSQPGKGTKIQASAPVACADIRLIS